MNKISKTILGAGLAISGTLSSAIQTFAAEGNIGIDVDLPQGFFFDDFGDLFTKVLRGVMVLAGLLVFAYLIWGGIEWITSGGDKGKTESARNKITAAVVGLIILAASYAIFTLILQLLNVEGFSQIFN